MTGGFFDEKIELTHYGYCYIWGGQSKNWEEITIGSKWIEVYTSREYSMYPIWVQINFMEAVPEICYEENPETGELIEVPCGYMPSSLGGFAFDVVNNPFKECCVDNFIKADEIEINIGEARWYTDRNTPPPLPGEWSWVYYHGAWTLASTDLSAYTIKFTLKKG